MTQTQRLIAWFRTGRKINPLEAWSKLGIYRLASRINDLKKQGYTIAAGQLPVVNMYGERCKVAEYTLQAEPEEHTTTETQKGR